MLWGKISRRRKRKCQYTNGPVTDSNPEHAVYRPEPCVGQEKSVINFLVGLALTRVLGGILAQVYAWGQGFETVGKR
ncbi:MAG: hypothetical protein ACJAR9_000346 [Celeribacter sp.]|jgi:hypothetical protein